VSWFDIGVNLTDRRLPLEGVLERAQEADVCKIVVIGGSLEQSTAAWQLARENQAILYSTAGVHPHYAFDVAPDYLEQLQLLAMHKEVVAIGECGLDFNRNFSPRDVQLAVFEAQLQLAVEVQKPVFLHERDAFSEQIALLQKYRDKLVGGVAHCFTGSEEQMQSYLELDLHIGITGWLCDPKRGDELRQAVTHLPLNRLLLETDAPYLIPKTLDKAARRATSGNNEPCYLPHIAKHLAPLMAVTVDQLRLHSFQNACKLFRLNETPDEF
jgi:TatD DNase family protein